MAVYIPTTKRRPHIFLSHSSKDKNFVRKLAEDLALCEVDVWLDEWEIQPGDSIYQAINEALENSQFVGLFLSPAFIESKWATEEVDSAFNKQIEKGSKVIIPLLIEEVELPALLRGKVYISFIDDYYKSLTKLVALVHNLDWKSVVQLTNQENPKRIDETLDIIRNCGFDPFSIIPKIVFDELSLLNGVEVLENRLYFYKLSATINELTLSQLAKNHLEKIYIANNRRHKAQ